MLWREQFRKEYVDPHNPIALLSWIRTSDMEAFIQSKFGELIDSIPGTAEYNDDDLDMEGIKDQLKKEWLT